MSAANLFSDLSQLGITLTTDGVQLVAKPTSAVTPKLVARIRECKSELIESLTSDPPCPRCGCATSVHLARWRWCEACEVRLGPSRHQLEFAPANPDEFDADGWPRDTIDFDEVPVCPNCGTVEA